METYRLLAFSAPYFVTTLVHGPMAGILPTLIVKYYGVEMAAMSTILLFSRMFDGVTDPLIGFLSDRTHSPIGKRKPWIIVGSAIVMIAVYHLFMPPSTAGIGFFMVWMLLITLGWTIGDVPYNAWITEITGDSYERTRIQTYRSAISCLAGFLLAIAPTLPLFETSEMTPEVLRMVGWVIIVALPPLVFAALVLNREGKTVSVREDLSFRDLLNSVKGNRPFRIFVLMFATLGLSLGITSTLNFLVFDIYLGIGDKFSQIFVPSTIVSFIALPIWLKIVARIGKNRALAVSAVLGVVLSLFLPFIEPGPGAFYPFLAITLAQGLAFGAYGVVPLPMLSDVVDYDILKTGSNRAGQYLSVLSLLIKFNQAIGGALAFFLLSLFGFEAANMVQTKTAVNGLLFTYVAIPFFLGFIAAYLSWRFPIDDRRQKIIRKRIEQRALRSR